MKIFQTQNNKGFTLVETLIYTAIFIGFVVTLVSFMGTINQSRIKNQITHEVNYQGSNLIRTMVNLVQNASSTNSPALSNAGGELSVDTFVPANNPTVINIATGTVYIKEGTNAKIALTNNKVEVSNFTITNFSTSSTPGVIQFRFTISNLSTLTKLEQQYSKDFYGSASLR